MSLTMYQNKLFKRMVKDALCSLDFKEVYMDEVTDRKIDMKLEI